MKLFIVENHLIELDTEELRMIPEFRAVIYKDKDRTKSTAFKEFKYIYYVVDFKSPYIDYPDKEKEKYARVDAGLEVDWKPCNVVKLALDKYRTLQETPSMKILNSLNKGLRLSSSVVDNVCNNIQYLLDEIENDMIELRESKEEDPIRLRELKKAGVTKQMEYTNALVVNLTTLQDLGAKVPKTLINIEELADKVRKETDGDDTVRGGKKKGNRADPNNR